MQKLKSLLVLIVVTLLCQGQIFTVDPEKNAVWHNEKGISFLELNYYDSAIREFQLAILLKPDTEASSTFYNNLGTAYSKIGDYGSAEKNFQRAMELKPFYIQYYKNYIDTFDKRNLLGTLTVRQNNKLIKNPKDVRTLLMLGLIHKELDNRELSAGYLRKFVGLAPDLTISNQLKPVIKELEK